MIFYHVIISAYLMEFCIHSISRRCSDNDSVIIFIDDMQIA
ncbi:hypothetical protein CSSP291_06875 [Cronobacter sakazakii SP291]|nr:hypothetical protein CSSP291_06875 [Cronobacter sakazakii SP291]EGL72784.1 hypothetical protein CSE899_09747 [Cronobacter sakazakii E899]